MFLYIVIHRRYLDILKKKRKKRHNFWCLVMGTWAQSPSFGDPSTRVPPEAEGSHLLSWKSRPGSHQCLSLYQEEMWLTSAGDRSWRGYGGSTWCSSHPLLPRHLWAVPPGCPWVGCPSPPCPQEKAVGAFCIPTGSEQPGNSLTCSCENSTSQTFCT